MLGNYGVEFHLQEPGPQVIHRIIDQESGEVIRQTLSKEMSPLAENLG